MYVRFLYQPGELEGGGKRATDPIWSLKVYNVQKSVTNPSEPVLYYLQDGPKRRFVCEELLVVPFKSEFPPENPWVKHKALRLSNGNNMQMCLCRFSAMYRFQIKWAQRDFVQPHPMNLVLLTGKHVYFVPEGFFGGKRLFVMHMPYFLFHIVLFRAFRLFDVFCLCQDWVHFWPKANILSDWHSFHLIFHLALNCFVCAAVKRVIFGIIACVV